MSINPSFSWESLVNSWIADCKASLQRSKATDHREAVRSSSVERMARDIVASDPELGWRFVVDVSGATSDHEVLGCLSAWPLEDLLVGHGHAVIEELEKKSRDDAEFRELLFGVWRNLVEPDVWKRIEVMRGSPTSGNKQ
jgi:hypothetical protein